MILSAFPDDQDIIELSTDRLSSKFTGKCQVSVTELIKTNLTTTLYTKVRPLFGIETTEGVKCRRVLQKLVEMIGMHQIGLAFKEMIGT